MKELFWNAAEIITRNLMHKRLQKFMEDRYYFLTKGAAENVSYLWYFESDLVAVMQKFEDSELIDGWIYSFDKKGRIGIVKDDKGNVIPL
jgi:hypothetical protein